MTEKTHKNSIIATVAGITLLAGILVLSNGFVNADTGAETFSSPCPADGTVEHWDKIIFRIVPNDASESIDPKLVDVALDLKILDPPNVILQLEEEIRIHLVTDLGISRDIMDLLDIEVIDVRYDTVTCGLLGPQGPIGPQGPQGSQGPEGELTSIVVRKENIVVPKGQFGTLDVECEEDEVATGGGFRNGGSGVQGTVISSQPLPPQNGAEPIGWRASVKAPNNSQIGFDVFAICVEK